MSELLLIGLIALAVLACPLHMWWMNRRGRRPACCPPKKTQQVGADAAELRSRRAEIEAQLAEFDVEAPAHVDGGGPAPRARG